jgi:hypothetical protein
MAIRLSRKIDNKSRTWLASPAGLFNRLRRMRVKKPRVLILAIVLAAALMTSSIGGNNYGADQSFSESQIKAAFLFNFTKFVEWPSDAFQDANSPIVIGTIAADPITSALETITRGKSVSGRAIVIKRIQPNEDTGPCHVLFVGVADKRQLTTVMNKVSHSSVLTVGDLDEFYKKGGIVHFFLENDQVRFEINLGAAESVRLKISSKLLTMARSVRRS